MTEATATLLAPERLYTVCDPSSLPFDTTDQLEDIDEPIGQDRAVQSIRFAIGMKHRGFNLFALGPEGTGRRSLVMQYLTQAAADQPTPDDWVYVNDFQNAHRPRPLRLPPGRAASLKKDMADLVAELGQALPAAFEAEEYRHRRAAIEASLKERQEENFQVVGAEAAEKSVALIRTPVGLALAPMRDGEVLSPDEFQKLPEKDQAHFKAEMERLQEKLEATIKQVPVWERETRAKVRELDQEVVNFAISHLMDEVKEKYADLPDVLA